MSMISAQIDELRNTAEFYDGFKAANLMRDAADTIWQLRDDLQQANAENARLRSELESVGTAAYLYGRGDLQAENVKLRELLQRLLTEYRYMRVRPRAVYLQHEERMRAIEEEMRELGIEVDG